MWCPTWHPHGFLTLILTFNLFAEGVQTREQFSVNRGMQTRNAFVVVVAAAGEFGLQVDIHKLLRTAIDATKRHILSGLVVHIGCRSRCTNSLNSPMNESIDFLLAWEVLRCVDVSHASSFQHPLSVLNGIPSPVAATTRVGPPCGPYGETVGMISNGVSRHLRLLQCPGKGTVFNSHEHCD